MQALDRVRGDILKLFSDCCESGQYVKLSKQLLWCSAGGLATHDDIALLVRHLCGVGMD